MNILFYYSTTIDPIHGGIQRVTAALGECFRKENNMSVVYLSTKKSSIESLSDQYYLPNQEDIFSKENELFFFDLIKKRSIDIVINQAAINPYRSEIIIWSKKAGLKLISVIHNSLFGMYGIAGHLESINNLITKLRLSNILNYTLLKYFKRKYGALYMQIFAESDQIVLLSDKFIEEIIFFGGARYLEKVISIPNPITIENNSPLIEKEKEILFVGRFSYQKRIDLLIQIWDRIYRQYPDWSLILVGNGEKREYIETLSKKKHLQNIYFEGYQPPQQYYKRASLFCLTSSFEGFGLVLIEAMASGVVPLAFNSYANVSDIIDNEINGMLVTPFSIDEYSSKLSLLIENHERRQKMSQAAINKSKEYDIAKITKIWLSLLSDIKYNT